MTISDQGGPMTSGRLIDKGWSRLSGQPVYVFQCVDCQANYTALHTWAANGEWIRGPLTVNGYATHLCPWCRPDSAPWKYGRGR